MHICTYIQQQQNTLSLSLCIGMFVSNRLNGWLFISMCLLNEFVFECKIRSDYWPRRGNCIILGKNNTITYIYDLTVWNLLIDFLQMQSFFFAYSICSLRKQIKCNINMWTILNWLIISINTNEWIDNLNFIEVASVSAETSRVKRE